MIDNPTRIDAATTCPVRDRYPLLAGLAGGRPLAEIPVTVTIDKPSYHGRSNFTLRPGTVDADAVEFFGFAKCHLLACAMHERTGWRFGVAHQLVDRVWRWSHAGVITPGGLFLDIHGTRQISEVVDRYEVDFGLPTRVATYGSYAGMLADVAPNMLQVPWTDGLDPLAVELTRCFADYLTTVAARNQETPR